MERIPEFNFPHFKPEIHNDKAGDQRVGGKDKTHRHKAHCRILKQNPVFSLTQQGVLRMKVKVRCSRKEQLLIGVRLCCTLHNGFCLMPLHRQLDRIANWALEVGQR